MSEDSIEVQRWVGLRRWRRLGVGELTVAVAPDVVADVFPLMRGVGLSSLHDHPLAEGRGQLLGVFWCFH